MQLGTIKILLIDDDSMWRSLIKKIFSQIKTPHYELEWASEYYEALKKMKSKEYNAFIIDYHLGDKNGLDLIKEARNAEVNGPFILISSDKNPELDKKAMEAGADDFLKKNQISQPLLEHALRYNIKNNYSFTTLQDFSKKILHAEQFFQTLLETSLNCFFVLDMNGDILYASPNTEQYFKKKSALLKGKNFSSFVRSDYWPAFNYFLAKAIAEPSEQFQEKLAFNDQARLENEPLVRAKSITGKSAISGILLNIELSTEREDPLPKLLYRSIHQSPASIIITDKNGKIEYVNLQFTEVTGYDFSEVVGKNPRILKSGVEKESLYQNMWSTILSGKTWHGDIHNKKKNGDIYWEAMMIAPIFDHNNTITHFLAIQEDITRRKKLEEKLKISEEKLISVFNSLDDMLFVLSAEGIIEDCNDGGNLSFYTSPKDFLGKHYEEVVPSYVSQKTNEAIDRLNQTGKSQFFEYYLNQNGEKRWYQATITKNKINQKENQGYIEVIRDVTSTKADQDALKDSEKSFRTYIESSPTPVFIADLKGDYTFVNQAACELLQYSKKEILSKNIQDFWAADDIQAAQKGYETILKTGKLKMELSLRKKDGSFARVLLNAVQLPKDSLLAFCTDISERIASEKALQDSEKRFRSIIESTPIGLCITDKNKKFVYVNSAYSQIYGYTPEELIGKNFTIVVPQLLKESMEQLHDDFIAGKKELRGEWPVINRKGETMHILADAALIHDMNNQPQKVTFVVNMTEQKLLENKIKKNEEQLRLLTENISDLICLHSTDGTYIYVSPSSEKLLGYHPSELIGQNPYDYFHPEDKVRIAEQSHRAALKGEPVPYLSYRFHKKDKTYTWIETHTQPVLDNKGNVIQLVTSSRDVSARREMENKIKDQNDFLIDIISSLLHPFYVVNANNYKIELANLFVYQNYYGLQDGEMKCYELINNQENECTQIGLTCPLKEVKKTKQPVVIEQPQKLLDGSKVYYEVHGYPVFDMEGQVEKVIVYSMDITERKKAEQKLEEMALFAQENPSPVIRINTDGKILLANSSAKQVISSEQFNEGHNWEEICPQFHANRRLILSESKPFQHEFKSNSTTLLLTYYYSSKYHFINIYGTDITSHKAIQEALKRRVHTEQLISSISNFFMALPINETDNGINYSLQEIGEFLNADRAYIFLFDKYNEKFSNTHEWCSKGISSQIAQLQNGDFSHFPWLFKKLKAQQTIHFPDIKNMPKQAQAEQSFFTDLKLKSILNVPLVERNTLIGFIGLDAVTKKKRWPQEDIKLLKITGEIITRALTRKQTRDALKVSEERYRNLFEQSNDAIFIHDLNGKIIHYNNQAAELLYYQKEELSSKNFYDFFSNKSSKKELKDLIIKQKSFYLESQLISSHQLPISIEISSRFIDPENNLIQSIIHDISHRKKAEEELKKLSQAVEQSFSTIVITDTKGKITYANPSFEKITGYSPKEAVGQDPSILKSDYHDDSYYKELWETISSGKTWHGEFKNIKKDGSSIWEEAVISPIFDQEGNITNYIAVKNNITQKKMDEIKIKAYNKKLAHELHEKQRSLTKLQSVQKSLTPIDLPILENVNILSCYMPSEELGGDMFDVQHIDNKVIIILADCTGHGLYAAMDTVLIKSISDRYLYLLEEMKTGEFLAKVNNNIIKYFQEENFLTMFVCVLDLSTNTFYYSNAASEIPYSFHNGEIITWERAKGHHIGLMEDSFFEQKTKTFLPGEIAFLYSDAVREIMLDNETLFGSKGIKKSLSKFGKGLSNDLNTLLEDVRHVHKELPLEDDTTIVMLENLQKQVFRYQVSTEKECCDLEKTIMETLIRYDYDNKTREVIGAIFEEAYLNGIVHGNKNNPDKKLTIDLEINCAEVVIKIQDEGKGFNLSSVPDPTDLDRLKHLLKTDQEEKYTHGRGLYFIDKYSDFVSWNEKGNQIIITKKRLERKTVFKYLKEKFELKPDKIEGIDE